VSGAVTDDLLGVCGLTHAYRGRPALEGVSFAVRPGEVVAVLGASGAGKSTLFRCITRLIEPDGGEVRLHGTDLLRLPRRSLGGARAEIGLIFQQFNLVRRLSARDNVLAGRLAEVPTWRVLARRFDPADEQLALACLDRVGLLAQADQRADRLSGGQQQRVAIARVLAQQSCVILADEPVASLDPAAARQVLDILRDIAREQGIVVLCSLHQVDLVDGFADRVLGLMGGALVLDVPVGAFDAAARTALYEPASKP